MDKAIRFLYTGDYDDNDDVGLSAGYSKDGKEEKRPEACVISKKNIGNNQVPLSEVEESSKAQRQPPDATDGDDASMAALSIENDQYASSLLVNVRVYILADFLMISDLKNLAMARFALLARHDLPRAGFVEVVSEVFASVAPGDIGLRAMIVRICRNNFGKVVQYGSPKERRELCHLLNVNEPFAWRLMIRETVLKYQHDLRMERSERQRAEERRQGLEDQLLQLEDVCRPFWIEGRGSGGGGREDS